MNHEDVSPYLKKRCFLVHFTVLFFSTSLLRWQAEISKSFFKDKPPNAVDEGVTWRPATVKKK